MGNRGEERRWIPLKIFFFLAVTAGPVLSARDCCPPNTILEEGKGRVCSDNSSLINLQCKNLMFLIDPTVNEDDKFTVEPNGELKFFDYSIPANEFCLGRIRGNGTEGPEHVVAMICSSEVEPQAFLTIFHFLMFLSTIFLILTLYIYVVLPNLKDLQSKCLIAFMCCLIVSFLILFVTQISPSPSEEVCIVEAALLYFSMSATFFWSNIITYNIWSTIRKNSLKIKEKSCAVIYLMWGFGVPLSMVLLSFILEHIPDGSHIRPHYGELKCWFRGKVENWAFFYGPITVLLLLNTAMFVHSTWELRKACKTSSGAKIKSLKFKYWMYLKLFLLMGISWIFEVISYATTDFKEIQYLWIVTDCFNSAQGIIIFLVLVVFRQKVRLGILKKKLFNINWPQSWAREELQESCTESEKDDVELANQKSTLVNVNVN